MASQVYTEEWLELEKQLGTRPCLKGSIQEMREQFHGLLAAINSQFPPPDLGVRRTDGSIKGIKYRIYSPSETRDLLPVALFTHGGGFVMGDLDTDDRLMCLLAAQAPCILVSVDYRLGPEDKLPAMLTDTLAVAEWVLQNAAAFNADASRFFTIGASAGGALALAVANHFAASDSHPSPVKAVVALVPLTLHPDNVPDKYKSRYDSWQTNGTNVPVVDQECLRTCFDAVEANPTDASIFISLSSHLSRFPPTYIVNCVCDPLRDDGRILEEALQQSGVQVKRDEMEGLPHYFWLFPGLKATGTFQQKLVKEIQLLIAGMSQ